MKLPAQTLALLDGAAARIRRIYLLRGLVATLAALLASAIAVMVIDMNFVIFSDGARWALTLGVYAAVAVVAVFALVRPLRRDLGHLRVAKILDGRHSEFEECFTTLVELAEPREGRRTEVSEALFEILCRKAEAAAVKIDLDKEFTSRTIVRRLQWLGGVGVLLCVIFAVVPHIAGRLFVRAIAPWVDVGNLYSGDISVMPGDILIIDGEKIRIEASVKATLGVEPVIRISRKISLGWSAEVAEPMTDGAYETIASLDEREWRYRISAGPAVSKYFRVKVCSMPKYEKLLAKVVYPEYTGLGTEVYSNAEAQAVSAFEGSKVSFEMSFPKEVSSEFRLGNKDMTELTLVSNRVTRWTLELSNTDGFKAPTIEGVVRSVRDVPPTVLVEKPAAKLLTLPSHAKFPFEISVSDDLGVTVPELMMRRQNGSWTVLRSVGEWNRAGATLWKGRDEIDLSSFDFLGEKSVEFAVAVRDFCPAEYNGPHAVTSTPVTVRFEVHAKDFEMQTLEETKREADKLVSEARKRIEDSIREASSVKDRISRENKIEESAQKQLEKTTHEASEAVKRTEELKRRLEEDARFKPMAEKLEKIKTEKLDPALAELRKAEFDDKEQKSAELNDATIKLRDALAELRKFDEQLNERTKEIDRLEQTKDLAARQDQLAKAAEEILKERPVDTKKIEAWKEMEQAAERKTADIGRQLNNKSLDSARQEMRKASELMDELKRELEKEARVAKEKAQAEKNGDEAALKRLEEQEAAEAARKAKKEADEAAKVAERAEKLPGELKAATEKAEAAEAKAASERHEAAKAHEAALKAQHEASEKQHAAHEAAKTAAESGKAEDRQKAAEAAKAAAEAQAVAVAAQEAAKKESSEARKAQAEAEQSVKAAERLEREAAQEPQDAVSRADKEQRSKALQQAESEQQYAMVRQNNALAAQKRAEEAESRGDKAAAEREREQAERLQAEAERAQREAAKAIERAENPPADVSKERESAEKAMTPAGDTLKESRESVKEGDFAKAAEEFRKALELEESAQESMKDMMKNPSLCEEAWRQLEKATRAESTAIERTRLALTNARNAEKNANDRTARKMADDFARDAEVAHKEAQERFEAAKRVQDEMTAQKAAQEQSRRDSQAQSQDSQKSSQDPQESSQQAQKPGKGETAASEARKAAAELDKSVARQAAALGIEASEEKPGNESEEAEPQDENDDNSSEDAENGDKSEGKPGKGRVFKEIAKKAKALKRADDPEAVKATMEKSGWFKIQGSANQGLTEKDLRGIPAEYRELVRAYFLKLSEEK